MWHVDNSERLKCLKYSITMPTTYPANELTKGTCQIQNTREVLH